MSNRGRDDDFDFDDDPFADDDRFDDPFGDTDDPFADDDDLRGSARRGDDFGGFDDDLGFNEDDLGGLGGDDDFEFDEDEEAEEGGNRRFVILAAIIIILFILALGGIVLFALSNQQNNPNNLTRTAIAEINATQLAFADATGTQAIIFEQQTATEQARPTDTPTITPISPADLTATGIAIESTQQALFLFQTQTVEALTPQVEATETPADSDSPLLALTNAELTRIALTPVATNTPIISIGVGTLSPADVLLTATALAQTLAPVTPQLTPGIPVATPPGIFPTRPPTTALPDTGLFDGMSGEQGLGVMMLMAFGLVGVIIVSRRLRR